MDSMVKPLPARRRKLIWHLGRLLPLVALLLLTGCPRTAKVEPTQAFTFAVAGDPRQHAENWYHVLQEIRDMRTQRPPTFPPTELLLVPGDMDPGPDRFHDFEAVFRGDPHMKAFLPVMGNHDQGTTDHAFMLQLIAKNPRLQRHDDDSASYFVDWKNVRFIAVDAYRNLGEIGIINAAGCAWIEELITGAPAAIQHIFICFHQPVFPRHRHVGESFDENPILRDAFWTMLVRHRDRVRAVFVAHTHYYSRMRVQDPASKAANDPEQFPDDVNGVLQVDSGAAGKGERNTVVFVRVEGKTVRFRVADTKPAQGEPFDVIDEWTVEAP